MILHEKENAAFSHLTECVNCSCVLTAKICVPGGLLWGNPALEQPSGKRDKRHRGSFTWEKPTWPIHT